MPPFKTLDDEATFWETHDTSLLGKVSLMDLPLLEKEKEKTLTVRLQTSVKEKLTKIAQQKGIGPTTLARMWIVERIFAMK